MRWGENQGVNAHTTLIALAASEIYLYGEIVMSDALTMSCASLCVLFTIPHALHHFSLLKLQVISGGFEVLLRCPAS